MGHFYKVQRSLGALFPLFVWVGVGGESLYCANWKVIIMMILK